jgi:glucoamylase
MLGAIGRNGAVVASPDESTPNQNYYFHWVRDGALTMNVVVSLYEKAMDPEVRGEYGNILKKYVEFSRLNQTAPNTGGFMGLGEPKFEVDGTVYHGNWGRPQNDGPALRSITLCRWANLLLNANSSDSYVTNEIGPVVKSDLQFVHDHWNDRCTDLWEEVRGKHFYTRMVARRALLDGAKLLNRIGETALASQCGGQKSAIETEISSHFDAAAKLIRVTVDIDGSNNGKTSQHDVAIVLAALHGETPDDEYFAPNDDRVLSTTMMLRADFFAKYPINQGSNATDSDGITMEPAIGRYPEDTYDGAKNQGGNAWFLATAAFAEQAYRTHNLMSSASSLAINDLNAAFYNEALTCAGSATSVSSGNTIVSSDARFTSIIDGLKEMGDRYVRQIRKHGAADGSLSEQIKKDSGYMTGAVDLTWSYAALLTAIEQR